MGGLVHGPNQVSQSVDVSQQHVNDDINTLHIFVILYTHKREIKAYSTPRETGCHNTRHNWFEKKTAIEITYCYQIQFDFSELTSPYSNIILV